MWRFRVVVPAIFALFQLGFWANLAHAEPIEISDRVWGSFQEYLREIGSTNPGAFAVTRDGSSSYYVYCPEFRCVSGQTYRHEALRRCEDMSGRECVLFALLDDIVIPYKLAPRTSTVTPASPATVTTPEPEEPPFESPLADGTIVLSHKIAAQLDGYLKAVDRHGAAGFFFVAPDGRDAGAYACDSTGAGALPRCPMKPSGPWVDPKVDQARVKQRAMDSCEADSAGECVMLYANDSRRAAHKITDNPAPKKMVTPASPAAVAALEPDEPPFESPLADGTIVLSRKVAAELDGYLKSVDRHGAAGFFFVAPNGRNAGAFVCNAHGTGGLALCPMKPMPAWSDPKPDPSRVKERARDVCQADYGGECIMLYTGDEQRAAYKIVE